MDCIITLRRAMALVTGVREGPSRLLFPKCGRVSSLQPIGRGLPRPNPAPSAPSGSASAMHPVARPAPVGLSKNLRREEPV